MSPARILGALLCLLPASAFGGSVYTPAPTPGGIGAQPVDATLTALAGGACVADTLLYCDGADTVAAGTITAAGRTLVAAANAADQRTAIGAGALCTGADSGDVPYTPAVAASWTDPDPTAVDGALDTLVGRVVTLESGGAGIGGTAGGTDNRLIRADGVGDTIQGSALTCDDSGNLSGLASVAIGGTTAASMLYSDSGAGTNRWRMDADAGQARVLSFSSGDVARWALRVDGAESGANAGGDIALRRYSDAGAFISDAWSAVRSTGAMTIPNVNITGGAISGITDLPIADGGTGSSTAAAARAALGVEGATFGWDWPQDVPLLADWPDAADAGAVDDVCVSTVLGVGVKIRAGYKTDCTTAWGSVSRAVGVLRSVAAGDFRVAFRLQLSRPGVARATGSTALLAGPAFVDGDSVDEAPNVVSASTDSWYGAGLYVSSSTLLNSEILKLSRTSGATRWGTYQTYSAALASPSWPEVDYVMERSGTTLNIYAAPARGAGFLIATHTVTAGAGLIGLRSEVLLSSADEIDILLAGYRSGLTELPW